MAWFELFLVDPDGDDSSEVFVNEIEDGLFVMVAFSFLFVVVFPGFGVVS